MQLKKENLKGVFWAVEFGRPNRYTSLQNDLNTSIPSALFDIGLASLGKLNFVNTVRVKV